MNNFATFEPYFCCKTKLNISYLLQNDFVLQTE